MRKLRAIGFDLDDTLYPEREYALSGFSAVADWGEGALGIASEEIDAELKKLFEAGVRRVTFNRWLESRGLAPELWLSEMVDRYRQHDPVLAPFPDVVDVLQSMQSVYRLAVLTQGYGRAQRAKVRALGIETYFEAIMVLDETEREQWKPDPRAFQRLLEQLGLPADELAYVGDNPQKDFFGARQLGIRTVRVRRIGTEHGHEQPADPRFAPDVEVAAFHQVPEALGLELSLGR